MIASLPKEEQGYGRLLAFTDPNALFKLVHENMLKRPDLQKGFEYAQTLPPDQKDAYLGQLFDKGLGIRTYVNERGEKVDWSPSMAIPGGAKTQVVPTATPSTGRTTAADWAVDNGFQVISGTRTQAESAALVHHYDENHYNNDPRNLIPLCPTHHQYVHSRYKDEIICTIDEYIKNKVLE